MRKILICLHKRYNGDFDSIYQAIKSKESVSYEEIKELDTELEEYGDTYITIIDDDYPPKLRGRNKPPFVI